jgi:hypothetical protein
MTDGQPDNQHSIDHQSRSDIESDDIGLVNESRYARIADYDDTQVGICIYLTVLDLRELGIDLSRVDANVIEYTIEDDTSRLAMQPRNR